VGQQQEHLDPPRHPQRNANGNKKLFSAIRKNIASDSLPLRAAFARQQKEKFYGKKTYRLYRPNAGY
jgi:hypothetical protein